MGMRGAPKRVPGGRGGVGAWVGKLAAARLSAAPQPAGLYQVKKALCLFCSWFLISLGWQKSSQKKLIEEEKGFGARHHLGQDCYGGGNLY